MRVTAVIACLLIASSPAQSLDDPARMLDIEGVAEDLALYVEAGKACGLPFHPKTGEILQALPDIDAKAAALGAKRGQLMFDGMIKQVGKAQTCAAAARSRAKAEQDYDTAARGLAAAARLKKAAGR